MMSDDPLEPINGSHEAVDRARDAGAVSGRQLSWPSLPAADEESSADGSDDSVELARLEAEISAAKSRAAAARLSAANQAAAIRAALREDLEASQQQLAEMERASEAEVVRIQADAEAEVARIVAEAEERAAAIRSVLEGERDVHE
jgi:hypothetical protein